MPAKTPRPDSDQPSRPVLLMPRAQAEERLRLQIGKGQKLLEMPLRNPNDMEAAQAERMKWERYNEDLLRRLVDTDDLYRGYLPGGGILFLDQTFAERVTEYRQDVRDAIVRLESISQRLELIPEAPGIGANPLTQSIEHASSGIRVFVVHGHDEEAKQSVARFVEKLGLKAIILHEQPNQGRTIIEKFEDYADVGFAIVLLTPDDVGTRRDTLDQLKPRARQNVILELGYFLGRLGRNRVCALYKGNVELPSDYDGVLWIAVDAGAWRTELAREMRAAGLDVDLNKL